MNKRYFDWLVRKVATGKQADEYSNMLEILYLTEFVYLLDKDSNRIDYALKLRSEYEISKKTQINEPVNVLEVLVSLSISCEDDFMGDYDEPDRTSEWFWLMIKNSGLLKYNDYNFDEHSVKKIIDIFLYRKYNRDGSGGGLFIVKNGEDLRKKDLWMQMMWYITNNIM